MAAVDWSTLPLDPLGYIAMKLETIEEFIYFSAVCHSWNCVSSLIKQQWRPMPMPWLLLAENTSNNPHCVRKIFNPLNNKSYKLNFPETFGAKCWGSDYGWVAMVDRNFDLRLFNPITKAEIHFSSVTIIPDRIQYDEQISKNEENYNSIYLRLFNPNRIYFTDDEYELSNLVTELGGHDMGVYDIKREEKWRFYEGDDMRSVYCRPTWFIPQL